MSTTTEKYVPRKAAFAAAVLPEYGRIVGSTDAETNVIDLIADLMHHAASIGIDPWGAVDSATMHYHAEIAGSVGGLNEDGDRIAAARGEE